MNVDRRDFFKTAAVGATAASLNALGVSKSQARIPYPPTDPSDPNAVIDPDKEIGKPYVGWKEGEFDVHFIFTGATECAFHIMPDGTTAIVDCGDIDPYVEQKERGCKTRPNDSRRSGEWVARYISRVLPELETIDYVVASHFHRDHTGGSNEGAGMTSGRDPDYQLSGIAHLGEFYKFGTAFDRGYPDYSRPTAFVSDGFENLVKFWEYKEKTAGLKREKFEVGALDQIKPLKAPGKYDFHVRNICANGVVWDGDSKNIDFFEEHPEFEKFKKNENALSLASVWEYGPFRFYTGGDVTGALTTEDGRTIDYEGRVGQTVGHVDVCKTNHHATSDAMRPSFVNAVQPRVYVTCVWSYWHLRRNAAAAMCDDSEKGYPGPRIMCHTGVHPWWDKEYADDPWRKYLVEDEGHVVIKAYDGGRKYKVYYLTCEDDSMNVKLVFGPFDSKRA